jgi:hypothetical protein
MVRFSFLAPLLIESLSVLFLKEENRQVKKSNTALATVLVLMFCLCLPPAAVSQQQRRTQRAATRSDTTATQPQPPSIPSASDQSANAKQLNATLTNAEIIGMVKAGFGETVVINAIRSNETQFDVSPTALFQLKNAGVSQKIIEVMQAAAISKRHLEIQQTSPSIANKPALAESPTTVSDDSLNRLTHPFVLSVSSSGRNVLTASGPTIVQTKAKGDNIGTIMADEAVRQVAADVVIDAAAQAAIATAGMGALTMVPIVGIAGLAIMNLPGLRRDPIYTFVFALPHAQSTSVINTNTPKFEIFYGDVVGANPDDFEPQIIRIHPTANNWRLVGAQKSKPKWYQSSDKVIFAFIEEPVPTRTTKLARGHAAVEMQQPLTPGEYAVVLRPKTYKMCYRDIAYRSGEGALVNSVWDFSVASPPN